uniref:Uncharacterized protein n=1 Tax=Spermophilus dauricus TaxID=99837 RepID=A0A8C9PN24_SPEDA
MPIITSLEDPKFKESLGNLVRSWFHASTTHLHTHTHTHTKKAHCLLIFYSTPLPPYPTTPVPFSPFFFRQASQQDHPHAAFNLAVGKLKNTTGPMEVGDIQMLLNVAARQGIQEAQELLENVILTQNKLLSTKGTRKFYKS